MNIYELHYSNTNTYLIEGSEGILLFDTGWAGTFPAFCRALKETGITLQQIGYILISHFHPDHMGIAGEIADKGPVILLPDVQKGCLHTSDQIFLKEKKTEFIPISDERTYSFPIDKGSEVLAKIGIEGCIVHTPGHSDDSISLCLGDGSFFVGDLNPLYELELHKGTQIEKSWERLLSMNPSVIYYGHAKTRILNDDSVISGEAAGKKQEQTGNDIRENEARKQDQALVSLIVKYIKRGFDIRRIQKKTGADPEFIRDVMRMYMTHQDISLQGILDRIEIKNR